LTNSNRSDNISLFFRDQESCHKALEGNSPFDNHQGTASDLREVSETPGARQDMANTLLAMKRHLTRDLTMSAKQLKSAFSTLENIFIRSIHRLCTKNLSLPTRKIVAKPLLWQAMKDKWLASAHQYRNGVGGGVVHCKKMMFSNKNHFELRFSNSRGCSGGQWAQTGSPPIHHKDCQTPAQDHGFS
jgi:hypothetical protein